MYGKMYHHAIFSDQCHSAMKDWTKWQLTLETNCSKSGYRLNNLHVHSNVGEQLKGSASYFNVTVIHTLTAKINQGTIWKRLRNLIQLGTEIHHS